MNETGPLLHIAGSEPSSLRAIGRTSQLPEQYGADIFWISRGNKYGVQRKEVSDLLSSADDGRLGKELAQLRSAGVHGVLVIEGPVSWTTEGTLNNSHGRVWRVEQWWGLQLSAALEFGIGTVRTKNLSETVKFVQAMVKWSAKDRHGSLLGRPGAQGLWGTSPTNEDFAIHLLTSVPGIGPENARAIYQACGNTIPLKLSVPWSTLENIKGVGPKKIAALKQLFQE